MNKLNAELETAKTRVVTAHSKKVQAWNKLAGNVYTQANEMSYYFAQDVFDITVRELINLAKLRKYTLAKVRGI